MAMVVAVGVTASGSPAASAPQEEPKAVPNELLVGYEPGATPQQRAAARDRANAQLEERVVPGAADRTEVELVRIPAGADRAAAARNLGADPAVAYAEPNWIYTHAATSSDAYYTDGSLWGMYGDATTPANLNGSQAGEAWADGNTGSVGVYVGVIDEGIQFDHPDLDGQVWTNPFDLPDGKDNDGNGYVDDLHGWDFDGNNNTIYDGGSTGGLDDHGTHVAGTIGSKMNNTGVVGVSPGVTMISGKFLGRRGGSLANAVKAVDYFTDLKTRHGLNVVATNNSWGGGGYSDSLYAAINRANNANILFIAAAGNGGSDGVGDNNDTVASYPSSYNVANVVAVAAIDNAGGLASFSNYGATTVDLGAPGVGVLSTTAYNTYSSYSGTSMATPHVTGGAALYAAVDPGATAATIKSAILSSAIPTTSLVGKSVTGGRLNVSGFGKPPAGATKPAAPTNLSATGGDGKIDLRWSPPAEDGGSAITGYKVYRQSAFHATTTGPSFADPVAAGGTYTYFVTAVNSVGESVASATASATATASPAPARDVTLTAGPKKKNLTDVTVRWVRFTGDTVNVTRSGRTSSVPNNGELIETWRGSGTVTYTVCDTTACASQSITIL